MAILDVKTFLSDKQDLTGTTASSTNILDFGQGKTAFGGTQNNTYNESVHSFNFVNVAIHAELTTAAAMTVTIQDSADGSSFADTSAKLTLASGFKAGTMERIALPKNCRRYIRINYAATALAGANVSAWVGFAERD